MKAHEETWNIEACFGFVKDVAGNIVAEVSTLTTADAMVETAQFISAAPDMARALISLMECTDFVGEPWYEAARAALKKAGVLP